LRFPDPENTPSASSIVSPSAAAVIAAWIVSKSPVPSGVTRYVTGSGLTPLSEKSSRNTPAPPPKPGPQPSSLVLIVSLNWKVVPGRYGARSVATSDHPSHAS